MTNTEASLSISVNGAALKGTKKKGRWRFTCNRWPDLAREHDGAEDASRMIEAFTTRALETLRVVKKAAGGK